MTIKRKAKTPSTPAKSIKRQDSGRFIKGASGNPKGPPQGYKKAKTKLIEERLEEYQCDPIEVMAAICNDQNEETGLRLQAAKELASYLYPKRKAIISEGKSTADMHVGILEINRALRRIGEPEIQE